MIKQKVKDSGSCSQMTQIVFKSPICSLTRVFTNCPFVSIKKMVVFVDCVLKFPTESRIRFSQSGLPALKQIRGPDF